MTERAETTQGPTPRLPEGPVDLRLVAVDMDGTLLDPNGAPPPGLPALLAELTERGIVFAPASGRQYATLAELFGPLGAGLTFIAENGSYVVRDGLEVSCLTLPPELVARVVARIRELARAGGDLGLVVCGKRSAWIERGDAPFLEQVRTYYEALAIVDDLDEVDDDVLKLAVFDFAGAERGAYPALAELPGTHRTIVSSHNWIDVMHPDADKGAALAALRGQLGVTVEQTAVFGDYLNDLGMLDEAGLSFAMANAHPAVIERARYVAPSNAEDGVVRTVRRLLD
ncbi:HAD family hydrolase [Pseudoclavibacter chungangensis]|uniref:HAD family hydrolase n=1 Tax=Pseudoclavibacter chungangensis TaxID=587635 RepID=A0A7J5BYI2_9MICO|nr:Cof-type HAD-IIB family hydrolase [Pseudoclavibacter chungangensis]KAB1659402.1 HAD family hydrolase [Pseudoclavibacter chungangensis]NYJ67757.1 hypothetical protein [Pseudoclavibacter chungangensis]